MLSAVGIRIFRPAIFSIPSYCNIMIKKNLKQRRKCHILDEENAVQNISDYQLKSRCFETKFAESNFKHIAVLYTS